MNRILVVLDLASYACILVSTAAAPLLAFEGRGLLEGCEGVGELFLEGARLASSRWEFRFLLYGPVCGTGAVVIATEGRTTWDGIGPFCLDDDPDGLCLTPTVERATR